jgi:hypothetical protein
MAIPQPMYVSTENEYRQLEEQRAGRLAGQVGQFANVMQGNRQLAEEQRQYDVRNQLLMADDIRKTQYGGNWVHYVLNDPTAEGVFQSIYGPEKGSKMFNDMIEQIRAHPEQMQTAEQMMDNTMREWFMEETQEQGNTTDTSRTPPGTTTPVNAPGAGRAPSTPTSMAGSIDRSINAVIPQGGQDTSSPALGVVNPQTERVPSVEESPRPEPKPAVEYRVASPFVTTGGQAPDLTVEKEVQNRGATRSFATEDRARGESAAYREDYVKRVNENGAVVNERGQPIGEGQEKASLPINRETLNTVFGNVQLNDAGNATANAKAIQGAFRDAGASEEAVAFIGEKTGYLRNGSEEQLAEYDRKSRELFGVDGDTMFAIRNQMFDNIHNGRPLGYMPLEGQRTQWWWTGKNMPIPQAAKEVIDDPDASTEDYAAVLKDGNKVNSATLSGEEFALMNQFLSKASERIMRDLALDKEQAKQFASSTGLGPEATNMAQGAAETLSEAESGSDIDKALVEKPKQEKFLVRTIDALRSTLSPAVVKQVGDHRYQERAAEAKEDGKPITFKQRMGISRKRYAQIKEEMEGPVSKRSPAIDMALPMDERQLELERRRLTIADEQFRDNLELQRDQLPETDDELKRMEIANRKAAIRNEAATIALQEMELDLMKDKFEAEQNGEAPPDYSLTYETAKFTYETYLKSITEGAEGDAEQISKQVTYLLQTNGLFKAAYETLASVGSAVSGLSYSEIKAEMLKSGGLFGLGKTKTVESNAKFSAPSGVANRLNAVPNVTPGGKTGSTNEVPVKDRVAETRGILGY